MEENELRIGNYVLIEGSILELNRKRFEYAVCKDCCLGMKPIPLSEEWLLKFGFKYREFLNDFFIKLDDHNILIAEKEVIGFAIYKCEENQRKYFLTKRYYIHQLQNLFYCLCGIDLELTLTE